MMQLDLLVVDTVSLASVQEDVLHQLQASKNTVKISPLIEADGQDLVSSSVIAVLLMLDQLDVFAECGTVVLLDYDDDCVLLTFENEEVYLAPYSVSCNASHRKPRKPSLSMAFL